MNSIEKLYSSIKNEKIRIALKDFANAIIEYQHEEYSHQGGSQISLNHFQIRWTLKTLIDEIQSQKIYVITCGDYDDYRIEGITSTPEIAKEFMDQFPDQKMSDSFNDLEEVTIDNLYNIPKDGSPYFVRINKDTFESMNIKKLPLTITNCIDMINSVYKDNHKNFMIYIWANNEDEASKNAIERLNKYLGKDNVSTTL